MLVCALWFYSPDLQPAAELVRHVFIQLNSHKTPLHSAGRPVVQPRQCTPTPRSLARPGMRCFATAPTAAATSGAGQPRSGVSSRRNGHSGASAASSGERRRDTRAQAASTVRLQCRVWLAEMEGTRGLQSISLCWSITYQGLRSPACPRRQPTHSLCFGRATLLSYSRPSPPCSPPFAT